MLFNLLEKIQKIFTERTEQEKLDDFIARQHPTSVGDVEYWINVYDRQQHSIRSANLGYYQYR